MLKFLDSEVAPLLAEAHRLLEGHRSPLRYRRNALPYTNDLAANRDALRAALKTLQHKAVSAFSDIATLFDEHNLAGLISAEDNYIRSLGFALQLPADTKLEILSDLLGPRVANLQIAVEEARRWLASSKHNLIALRESGR